MRLESVAREDPGLQGEIGLLHAELVFYDRVFATVIEEAERLLVALEYPPMSFRRGRPRRIVLYAELTTDGEERT